MLVEEKVTTGEGCADIFFPCNQGAFVEYCLLKELQAAKLPEVARELIASHEVHTREPRPRAPEATDAKRRDQESSREQHRTT